MEKTIYFALLGGDVPVLTSTEAKNTFGSVLRKAAIEGAVAITRNQQIDGYYISKAKLEQIENLIPNQLLELEDEFADLVQSMQTSEFNSASQSLFSATSEELGADAVIAAKKTD